MIKGIAFRVAVEAPRATRVTILVDGCTYPCAINMRATENLDHTARAILVDVSAF